MLGQKALVLLLITLTSVLVFFAWPKTSQHADWLNAQQVTLPNGLTMIHIPNHRAPVVHVSVWYKAGGAQDPKDKVGLAHYMEHLMFRPPIGDPDYNFSNIVNNWGGDNNAFTSYDVTAYFATMPSEKADDYLRMESARMAKLAPYPDQAATELEVIGQERAQTVDSQPRRLFNEKSNDFLYKDHPYKRSLIGMPDDIKGLTYDAAQKFHAQYYAPNNAVVVITGDITWAKSVALTKIHFGRIKNRDVPMHDMSSVNYNKDRELIVCDARIKQPEIHIMYPMPSDQDDRVRGASASIIASALDADPSNALYQDIVETEKLVSSYSVNYDADLKYASALSLSFWPSQELKDHRKTQKLIHDRFMHHIQNINQDKIDDMAQQTALLYQLAADTPISLAMSVGYEIAKGQSLIDIQTEPNLLESIKKTNVDNLITTYINNVDPYVTMLLPKGDMLCAR